ncbi:MAG: hypothetical protein ACRC33_30215, partial [Gemmataceae bacterium]
MSLLGGLVRIYGFAAAVGVVTGVYAACLRLLGGLSLWPALGVALPCGLLTLALLVDAVHRWRAKPSS